MGRTAKLVPMGTQLGVILPQDLLHPFGLRAGDEVMLFVKESVAREVMSRDEAVLRELAKR